MKENYSWLKNASNRDLLADARYGRSRGYNQRLDREMHKEIERRKKIGLIRKSAGMRKSPSVSNLNFGKIKIGLRF